MPVRQMERLKKEMKDAISDYDYKKAEEIEMKIKLMEEVLSNESK